MGDLQFTQIFNEFGAGVDSRRKMQLSFIGTSSDATSSGSGDSGSKSKEVMFHPWVRAK